jgi:hypothetical protein
METLALQVLGSVVTVAVLSLAFILVTGRRSADLPAYWLGFISALLWLPAFAWSCLKPVLAKEHAMPVFDWIIGTVFYLTILGFWSLLCSIPARMVGAAYGRLRKNKQCELPPS